MRHLVLSILLLALSAYTALAQNPIAIDEEAMLDAINELRTEGCVCVNNVVKPVPTVKWDKELADIALEYAIHLKNNNPNISDPYMFMSHVGLDGSTIESRLADADYKTSFAKENIAFIRGKEDMVIDHWLNNPQTCNNLLEKKATHIGAARSGNFWVLILAQPTVKAKAKKSKESKEIRETEE